MKLSDSLTVGVSVLTLVGAAAIFNPMSPRKVDATGSPYQLVLDSSNQPTIDGASGDLVISEKYIEIYYGSYGSFTTVPGAHLGLDVQGGGFYNHTPIHGIHSIRVDWTSENPSAKIGVYFATTSAAFDEGFEPALSGTVYTPSVDYDYFHIATYFAVTFTAITISYTCVPA